MVWHTRRSRAHGGAAGKSNTGISAASASQSFGYSSDAAILAASLGECGRTAAEMYKRGPLRSPMHPCLAIVEGNMSQMSCRACVGEHGDACRPGVPQVANRDDLMATAFWPEDFTSPLKVSITAVSCVDLDPKATCRAAETQNPVLSDIFVSLTRMQAVRSVMLTREIKRELGEQKADLTEAFVFMTLAFIAGVVGCLGCVVCMCRRLAKANDDEYGSVASG
eukprot:CAMPEP_0176199860 /NCGR_PEP_ID=MMETSP0121_2-20121125/8768_1 /TAXON_ID=160619 /ORGANISM="Kryptoperidinium foliaceum, Strain CCMP 1326" /LENGTH=222 /DNA_ID=CAMNT_0017538719 /DNA_START=1 /DNA_END=669 /DNA_ORIENTATION=-